MSDALGLPEAVSIALGGMIGGGIYAVLGVVTRITGPATWAAFALAGVVAFGAGYSYVALNAIVDGNGGSVTFVQYYTGNATLAGMVGWSLLVGYVGSMAMYAFAFAEFAVALGVPSSVLSVPVRPVVSAGVVAAFVALNLLGARASGSMENLLVAVKIAILVAFGVVGLVAIGRFGGGLPDLGGGRLTGRGPLVAAAISFVSFQGWQLLFYDQESIQNPVATIRRAVYVAIPVAVTIYVLVAVVTVELTPQALATDPHVVLKDAAARALSPYGLAAVGATTLSLSALFSTGSAINATLFSSAHLAKGMLRDDLLPDRIGDGDADGVPPRTLVVLGGITAAFSMLGSLRAITSFASLSFIVVFGAMSYLAFRERTRKEIRTLPPVVGLIGCVTFFPLMLTDLYVRRPNTFYVVLVVAAAVLVVELLYFEREYIEYELDRVERFVDGIEREK